jgi:hypothetical protein
MDSLKKYRMTQKTKVRADITITAMKNGIKIKAAL